MTKIYIDLHVHSTYSDGILKPVEIVREAKEKGVQVVALTDHDTLDGIPEFLVEAKRLKQPVVYGVEFTTRMNGRDLHILGYNFDPGNQELLQAIQNFTELQALFNLQRIVNFEENFGRVINLTGIPQDGNMTPIRLAYWLLETEQILPENFPTRVTDLFHLFEHPEERFQLNYAPHLPQAEEIVKLIQKANGFSVLAHPQSMRVTFDEFYKLYAAGLKGIEAFYPDQNPELYLDWAQKFSLGVTAGNDYHGVLDRNERSIGFTIHRELPENVYFYTGDIPL